MKISKLLTAGIITGAMLVCSAISASASFDPDSLLTGDTAAAPAETTAAAASFNPNDLIGGSDTAAAPAETTAAAPTTDNPILTSGTTPTAGDTTAPTSNSKGSPNTGVEDIAPLAGLALVSAGIIFATKKRK